MNPLQYTSEEMFSSTELIRKSKKVFDKLQKEEIEKAIILRDGKPAFMLLDFSVYEELMSEYISLKEMLENKESKKEKVVQKKEVLKNENEIDINPIEDEFIEEPTESEDVNELNEKDLEEALAEIESLNLDDLSETPKEDEEKEPLKEFWEK